MDKNFLHKIEELQTHTTFECPEIVNIKNGVCVDYRYTRDVIMRMLSTSKVEFDDK